MGTVRSPPLAVDAYRLHSDWINRLIVVNRQYRGHADFHWLKRAHITLTHEVVHSSDESR